TTENIALDSQWFNSSRMRPMSMMDHLRQADSQALGSNELGLALPPRSLPVRLHWSCRTGTKYRERSPRACALCAICASLNAGGVAQLAGHFARRRRLRGDNRKYLHETMLAMGR